MERIIEGVEGVVIVVRYVLKGEESISGNTNAGAG